ncbi:HAD-IC family P-type ATPase [Candidatus Microgenomates bacterium]|nr:HAD-IC family P-type ATPase [Candidatus Microgenomates bacterium]
MLPSGITGLTNKKAKTLLEKHGPNKLPENPPPTNLKIFLNQLTNPLVYVLFFAGIVSLILKHPTDTIIIGVAVGLNSILGFFQERKSNNSLLALKKLLTPKATVVRSGKQTTVDLEDIVPGDVVVVNQGSKIPGDGKVLFANRFFSNEAIITGESFPVEKEKSDEVFMGSVVTTGRAYLRIEKTGKSTKMGSIAKSVQTINEDTPLKKQLTKFSRQLVVLVVILTALVFVVGIITGKNWEEIFKTAVALAVSAIPEGLLVSLTVVLAIGMQRILKRKGLVRHLSSAETLGGVTVICVDKTGTLTKGEMKIEEVLGDESDIAIQMLVANDLDDPLTIASFDWARKSLKNYKTVIAESVRIDSLPFSSTKRFFASLNKKGKEKTLYVTGAPDYVLGWCDLKKVQKLSILKEIQDKTKKGNRLIGLAKKKVSTSKNKISESDIGGLEWVGILSFSDPVRSGVAAALQKAKLAGIKIKVITGDFTNTAINVMNELGLDLKNDQITTGSKLSGLNGKQISRTVLFARTTPDQKLDIVKALKDQGEVVAMTGDGVNDAPALAISDIGIVVGSASDVAKESSDLVLIDSNFATIVAAVEEGRGMFDNIRKIILYLISDAFEEIVAVLLSLFAGLPLPVTAAQILWINLVSDGFPAMALAVDPKRHGTMEEPPRNSNEALVSSWIKKLILVISLAGGIVAFTLFFVFFKLTNNLILARSVAFASLGVNSLVYVFSVRTLREPFWKENIFGNKWLNVAVIAGFGLQVLPFATSTTRSFFQVTPLTVIHWGIVFSGAIVMFILIELLKWLFSK